MGCPVFFRRTVRQPESPVFTGLYRYTVLADLRLLKRKQQVSLCIAAIGIA